MFKYFKNHHKSIVIISLLCVIFHTVLIVSFAPTSGDFKPNKTISGIYTVLSDQAAPGISSSVLVGNTSLICGASYLGPERACSASYKNEMVTVRTATYRYALGSADVVVDIVNDRGRKTQYSDKVIIHSWWESSVVMALIILQFQIPLFIFLFNFLTNKVKK